MTTQTKRSAKSSRIKALVGDACELLKGRLEGVGAGCPGSGDD